MTRSPFGRTTGCTPFTMAGGRWASTPAGADQVRPPSVEWRVSMSPLVKFIYER